MQAHLPYGHSAEAVHGNRMQQSASADVGIRAHGRSSPQYVKGCKPLSVSEVYQTCRDDPPYVEGGFMRHYSAIADMITLLAS